MDDGGWELYLLGWLAGPVLTLYYTGGRERSSVLQSASFGF